MRTDIWMRLAEATLRQAGIGTAHLDALVLLEDATHKERSWLLAHPEFNLSQSAVGKLNEAISQRADHQPLAYIRHRTEFYGRDFYIDCHVLEPRPESETMIDLLNRLEVPDRLTAVDIGTGSGAIGITVAFEHPTWEVILTDIDPLALQTARQNLGRYKLNLKVYQGDLLLALPSSLAADILLCNLPYVPNSFQLNPAAMAEPKLAIFGGPDGMDPYRSLFQQLAARSHPPAFILTESMPPQHALLRSIARPVHYHQIAEEDFIQVFSYTLTNG